jgi:hypothetical protein
VTPHLDLVVGPSEIRQGATGVTLDDIPAAIKEVPVPGDEAHRGEGGAVEIALRHLRTSQQELATGRRLALLIHDTRDESGQRQADHRVLARQVGLCYPVERCIHGGFSDSVHVCQGRPLQSMDVYPRRQRGGPQSFPGEDHVP